MTSGLKTRLEERIERSFNEESQAGMRQAVIGRTISLVLIGVWMVANSTLREVVSDLGYLGVFILLGFAQYIVSKRAPGLSWPHYIFISTDMALLGFVILGPGSVHEDWPRQMAFRMGGFAFFYVVLAGTMLLYSPRRVIWAGFSVIVVWLLGLSYVLDLPGALTAADFPNIADISVRDRLVIFLKPTFVWTLGVYRELFVFFIVTGILASVVWRMRRLAYKQIEGERQRANLARYFSPEVANEIVASERTLGAPQSLKAAVLFADIVGFTRVAEDLGAEATMHLLRDFHARMAAVVFDHHGTLDKYIGDEVMATFGALHHGPRDAANALACAQAMTHSMDDWNHERAAQSLPPIHIGVGVHYGDVVVGDIGDERRLEFATIGDTVNVASRMERLTRDLSSPLVFSDAVVQAAGREGEDIGVVTTDFVSKTVDIRGRDGGVALWHRK